MAEPQTQGDYERDISAHLDAMARNIDRVCEERLKASSDRLSVENPPYPPPHCATLARVIHFLSMRAIDAGERRASGCAGRAELPKYAEAGRFALRRYLAAVERFNDAFWDAAQSGALRLRASLTGLPHEPKKRGGDYLKRFEEAIFDRADFEARIYRKAAELLLAWPLLDHLPHPDIAVSLPEVDAWAAITGIAADGGVSAMLREVEAVAQRKVEATRAAIEAETMTRPAPSAEPATPANGSAAVDVPAPLSSPTISAAFDGLNSWNEARWAKALGDGRTKWLIGARKSKGSKRPGDAATWDPVIIALALKDKGAAWPRLDAVFKKSALRAWREKWERDTEQLRE